jgi:hypothetical protein
VSERLQKQVSVCGVEEGYNGWPSRNADEFISWLSEKLADIPDEFRASAEVVIGSSFGYNGDSNAEIAIFYYRPETDAEIMSRIDEEKRIRRYEKEKEIRLLNALKAKYET